MEARVPASPTGSRPYAQVLLTTFFVLAAVGAWLMRISTALYGIPVGFDDVLAAGAHPNGTPIHSHYTGIESIDAGLALLVTAFLHGPTGWNEAFYWQQFHFLVQFTAFIAIINIEACRQRNAGSSLKYTAIWALFYQTIGGAIVISIYGLMFHRVSSKNAYFQTGRTVPLQYARVILPSIVLLYVVPTLAVFWPGNSIIATQQFLAFWQIVPLLVNVPMWLVSPSVSAAPAIGKAKTADLIHLKVLYYVLFIVSTVSHWFTIFNVVASETPGVSLVRVFVPNPATWKTSMDMGLLWIFQWDWIIIAAVIVISAIVAVFDVQRFVPDIDTDSDRVFKGVYIVLALVVLGGPGAAMAAIWGFREEQLAVIEERGEKERAKKGN